MLGREVPLYSWGSIEALAAMYIGIGFVSSFRLSLRDKKNTPVDQLLNNSLLICSGGNHIRSGSFH
jgi:hypothetical protein